MLNTLDLILLFIFVHILSIFRLKVFFYSDMQFLILIR